MRPCRRTSAAVSIQAAWRSFRVRQHLGLSRRVLQRRAAVCLQRWWRMRLYKCHLRMLEATSMLVDSLSVMTLAPTLCLTLLSARLLGFARSRTVPCLPSHFLQWAFVTTPAGVSGATRLTI